MSDNIVDLNSFHRGSTRAYLLTFTDSDGDAINITDWTVYFTMKKNYADAEAKISKDITEHSDAEGGLSIVTLTSDDTDLVPGKYFYDIQIKKDDGSIETVLSGQVQILAVNRKVT